MSTHTSYIDGNVNFSFVSVASSKLFLNLFTDTYKAAKAGLKKSEVTSDLDSGVDQYYKTSRGRHVKRLFHDDKQDEEEDDPDVPASKQKRLPIKAPPVISHPIPGM